MLMCLIYEMSLKILFLELVIKYGEKSKAEEVMVICHGKMRR